MDKILARLPRAIIATIAIVLGTAFFILNDPPRTLCDVQEQQFVETQTGFLYSDPKQEPKLEPEFNRQISRCRASNGPGGCYGLFVGLRGLIDDIDTVSNECEEEVGDDRAVREAIWQSLDLLSRAAWGAKPPVNLNQKMGWLDAADMALFCKLKKKAVNLYGKNKLSAFIEKQFKELPGAANMERQEVWSRMILSVNCSGY